LRLTATGIALGLAAARLTTSLLAGMVQGVGVTDVRVFMTTALLLALIAMSACLFPALRATAVDPNDALRSH
jgi:ABC-type antimicrobial peptide transport system permease subunit